MSERPLKPANLNPKRGKGEPFVLPPGVTSARFAEFLQRCRAICGSDNVIVVEAEDQLVDGSYYEPNKTHDMHHIVDKEYFVCSATIAPREVSEVQDMMRLCNEFEVPVWPVSIGRNTGYGGAAPRVPGSIVLDMGKHMNRVLEANADDAYVLLEPGVTFLGLYEYLQKHNLADKLWIDVSPYPSSTSLNSSYLGDHRLTRCKGSRLGGRIRFGQYHREGGWIHAVRRLVCSLFLFVFHGSDVYMLTDTLLRSLDDALRHGGYPAEW